MLPSELNASDIDVPSTSSSEFDTPDTDISSIFSSEFEASDTDASTILSSESNSSNTDVASIFSSELGGPSDTDTSTVSFSSESNASDGASDRSATTPPTFLGLKFKPADDLYNCKLCKKCFQGETIIEITTDSDKKRTVFKRSNDNQEFAFVEDPENHALVTILGSISTDSQPVVEWLQAKETCYTFELRFYIQGDLYSWVRMGEDIQLMQVLEDTSRRRVVADYVHYDDGGYLEIPQHPLGREFENYCIVSAVLALRILESMRLVYVRR